MNISETFGVENGSPLEEMEALEDYEKTHINSYRYQCKKSNTGFPLRKKGNYESLFSFKRLPPFKEFKEKGRKWIYVRNYQPVMDRIILDIDCEGNLEKAYNTTKNIIEQLQPYNSCINTYFSGSKGFHVEILTEELDIIDTTVDKPMYACKEYANFLNYWMSIYPEVDLQLKDVGTRIFRKHHTKHEKTGNFKVLVDINAVLEDILECSRKNLDMVPVKTQALSVNLAIDLLQKYSKPIIYDASKMPSVGKSVDNNIFSTVYNDIRKASGQRHNTIFLLASGLNGYMPLEEALEVYEVLAKNTDITTSDNAKLSFIQAFKGDTQPFNLGALYNKYMELKLDLTNFDKLSEYLEENKGLSFEGSYDFYSDVTHYKQKDRKIIQIKKQTKELKDGSKKQYTYEVIKAFFSVNKIIRYTDILELSEPLFTLEYYHGYNEELKTVEKMTKEQILKHLLAEDLFISNYADADKIFKAIRYGLHDKGLMQKEKTLLYTGFFIDKGKLISNTNIDNLSTSPDDLTEAMQLLIGLLEFHPASKYKIAAILRKMLYMPFNYCLKQLGFANGVTNGSVVYGSAQSAKTTSAKIGLWFYLEEPYNYDASTDTLSSLVRTMAGTTFPTILDDAYMLFQNENVQNTIKKAMYEKYSRSVAKKDDPDDVVSYPAFSTPIFTYNEHVPISDDGLRRRLDYIKFDKSNVISKEESIQFKVKFNPLTKESILEKLQHIGIAYRDFIKPYLEASAVELNDMEALTIKFFEGILKQCHMKYDPLITRYDYETSTEQYADKIRAYFNKQLLNSKFLGKYGVSIGDLMNIADSGYFSWLKYQPKNHQFIIVKNSFVEECNTITNHTFSFEDLMQELDIMQYEYKQIKVGGSKIRGTFVEEDEIVHKIFNINKLLYEREASYVTPPEERG